MDNVTIVQEIRWADIDPNFHVLHSKYYDYCANARMQVLSNLGITMDVIQKVNIGPVLLREEAVFKRELKFGDVIAIKIMLRNATEDYARWSFTNEIWKNNDTLAAVVTVDGGWIDTVRRKLVAPPELFQNVFAQLPKVQNQTT
jgi:acyl-CoA thioester hydrolase